MDNWIKINSNDDLPPDRKEVFICIVLNGFKYTKLGIYIRSESRWMITSYLDAGSSVSRKSVTHWQPKPEPPQD